MPGTLAAIESFDDAQGVFTSSDPYLGPGHQISYGDFAQIWAPRGYTFLVLYPASRQASVSSVLAAAGCNRRQPTPRIVRCCGPASWMQPGGAPAGALPGIARLPGLG